MGGVQHSQSSLLAHSHPHTPTAVATSSPPPPPHLLPPSLHSPPPLPLPQPSASTTTLDLIHYIDKGIVENVDLPGLAVEDIDAVLSENSDWSGEQVEQFLRSAVDLSEIESRLFSVNGYESDSGYSTYDVSPITGGSPLPLTQNGAPPPLQVGGQFASRSLSPALTPVDPSPLISLSPTSAFPLPPPPPPPSHQHAPHPHHHHLHTLPHPPQHLPHPHSMLPQPSSEAAFFHRAAAVPNYQPFSAPLPQQDGGLFSGGVSQYSMFQPLPAQHEYVASCSGISGPSCFSEFPPSSTTGSFSSEFTDLLDSAGSLDEPAADGSNRFSFLDTVDPMPSGLMQRRSSDGQLSDGFFSDGTPKFKDPLPETRSLPNLGQLSAHDCQLQPSDVKPSLLQSDVPTLGASLTGDISAKSEPMRPNSACVYSSAEQQASSGDEEACLTGSANKGACLAETEGAAVIKNEVTFDPSNCSMPTGSPAHPPETTPTTSCSSAPMDTTSSPVVCPPPHDLATNSLTANASEASSMALPCSDTPLPTDISSLLSVPGNSLQSLLSLCSQMPVLNKLVSTSNNPAVFLVAISTALSTLTQPLDTSDAKPLPPPQGPINISQLQSLVARIGASQLEKLIAAKQEAINAMSSSSPSSATQLPKLPGRKVIASPLPPGIECSLPLTAKGLSNSHCVPPVSSASTNPGGVAGGGRSRGQKGRLHRSGRSVSMKSSAKKKSQWPRSMNKANLMAFREHILNKLKKSPDGTDASNLGSPLVKQVAAMPDTCSTVTQDSEPCSYTKCNGISSADEFEVTYERNSSGGSCSGAGSADSDRLTDSLFSGQSSTSGESDALETMRLPLLSDILLHGGDYDGLLSFQFNPDTLLSSCSSNPSPDGGFGTLMSSDDEREEKLVFDRLEDGDQCERFDDLIPMSDVAGGSGSGFGGSSVSDGTCLSTASASPVLTPIATPHLPSSSSSSSPLLSPSQVSPSQVPPANGAPTVPAPSPVRLAASSSQTLHPRLPPSSTLPPPPPPSQLKVHPMAGSSGLNSLQGNNGGCGAEELSTIGLDGECTMHLQITNLDSILQTHHDPLLAGSTCRSELFDF